jgi:hypothetical protein
MVLENSIKVRWGSTYEQVGEDRGSKEMDRCPLTDWQVKIIFLRRLNWGSSW